MSNHERAFHQMKTYYNDITSDNIKLIRSLKEQVSEMKKRQVANQKLMHDISLENQRLKEPLTATLAEVAELRAQLKERDKDKLVLRNAKSRLANLQRDQEELKEAYRILRHNF